MSDMILVGSVFAIMLFCMLCVEKLYRNLKETDRQNSVLNDLQIRSRLQRQINAFDEDALTEEENEANQFNPDMNMSWMYETPKQERAGKSA